MADVYWIGQDGNYWLKSSNGVQNMGTSLSPLSPQYIDSLQEIRDPALPPVTTQAPSNPTGGTARVVPQLDAAGVRNTQTTIDQLPGLLAAALGNEDTRYNNAMGEFGQQEASQRGTYDKSTVTNQQNYDENFMDSIRAGVKGLGGLFNILRGTGATGGSVEGDVRNMVGGITSKDIRTGADTQKENQGQLDSSLETFLNDLGRKRKLAEDTKENNRRTVTRDNQTQLQELYGKMAGFYGAAEQGGNRDWWMNKANELTPSIAQNSRAQLSAYDTSPVQVRAPEITAFAAPTQPDAIVAPQDGQVGSGIFTMEKRRREPTVAGV